MSEWAKAVAAKGQPITSANDARLLAWANGMRTAKASGAFSEGHWREEDRERAIAYWREAYAHDEIDLEQFELHIARELA